jgi:hypothetical protein
VFSHIQRYFESKSQTLPCVVPTRARFTFFVDLACTSPPITVPCFSPFLKNKLVYMSSSAQRSASSLIASWLVTPAHQLLPPPLFPFLFFFIFRSSSLFHVFFGFFSFTRIYHSVCYVHCKAANLLWKSLKLGWPKKINNNANLVPE